MLDRKRVCEWRVVRGTTFTVCPGSSPKRSKQSPLRVLHKSHEELRALAEQTKKNAEDALRELKNELARMAGRVVLSDHTVVDLKSIQLPSIFDPPILSSSEEESSSDE